MDFLGSNQKTACMVACGVIVFVVSIILFALSWDTVEPIEWGLCCNSISKTCDEKSIYEGGRYFIWLFHYFITFPANLQTIEFSSRRGANAPALKTRTAEGLNLGLHISFQYQLIRNEIPKLYSMNNKDYELTFVRIARDIILQSAGRYEAPAYWLNRSEIAKQMQEELSRELEKAHAKCPHFQLLNIELPDPYEASIVNTQVEVQNKKMKQFEQEAELIRQEVNILRSKTEQEINAINASAKAEAYTIRQEAIANSTNITIDTESESYKHAKDEIFLSGEEMNKYIFYLSAMGQKDAKLIFGMDNGIVNLK